jgi:hypothetical protein
LLDSIQSLFSALSSASSTLNVIRNLIKKHKGESRVLLQEIKENVGLCWMVLEMKTDPLKIIPELRTVEYDQLLKRGFNFNTLKRKKIPSSKRLQNSNLRYFIGKDTSWLIENIYDRIKTLKRVYRVDRNNQNIFWKTRVFNLNKRILLLLWHLKN